MRNSLQKQLVLDALKQLHHPSVMEIYTHIQKMYPHISMGTVYRNLNRLVESKKVTKLSFSHEADRFELEGPRHYHIVCSKCGAIADLGDIEPEPLIKLGKRVEASTGFLVHDHDLFFNGLCPQCRRDNQIKAM